MRCCVCWPTIINIHSVAKWKFCTTTYTCLNQRKRETSLLPWDPWGMRSFMGMLTHTHTHDACMHSDAQWFLSLISQWEGAKIFFAFRGCVFSFLFVFVCTASFRAAEFPWCLHNFSSPNLSNAVTGSELGERMSWLEDLLTAVAVNKGLRLMGGTSKDWPKQTNNKYINHGSLFIIHLSCRRP